jgi:hypothetical protein
MLVISLSSSFLGIVNMKYSRKKLHLIQLKLIHTHENNSSSLVDNIRNDTSIWKDDMSKQFEMTKDIVMPIINT